MIIRKCPDCDGKGTIWVPQSHRESYHWESSPYASITAGSLVKTVRPEYETCELCKGSGKVAIQAAEVKP